MCPSVSEQSLGRGADTSDTAPADPKSRISAEKSLFLNVRRGWHIPCKVQGNDLFGQVGGVKAMKTQNTESGLRLDLVRRMAPLLLAGIAATCIALPVSRASADSRETAPTERLEWLLTTHDVRQAIHAPAKANRTTDCTGNKAEHAR